MPRANIHQCDALLTKGVSISHTVYFRETPTWCIEIYREATEEDLENNHYLEEVGESLWQTVVEIRFCPYCGASLYDPDAEPENNTIEFMHLDQTGWKTQRS